MVARPEGARAEPRSDDRTVPSGVIHVRRNGLRWRDAPSVYGRQKTLYERFVRRIRHPVFGCILRQMAQLGAGGTIIIMWHPPQVSRHGGKL